MKYSSRRRPVITIMGTGAMACLYGAYLSRYYAMAGCDARNQVYLFGSWQQQIDEINKNGISITAVDHAPFLSSPTATSDAAALPASDIVLVLVKSHQTILIAPIIKHILNTNGICITLQNGLGNSEQLSRFIEEEQLITGTITNGAWIVRPGRVCYAGRGETLLPRPAQNRSASLLYQLEEQLNCAEFSTRMVTNIEEIIWMKLAINAAINPLTAILRIKNGELLEQPFLKKIVLKIVDEVTQIAISAGIRLDSAKTQETTLRVCAATAENYSSMLQDVQRSAMTEIDAICGALIKKANGYNIACPFNMRLIELVKRREKGDTFSEGEFAEIFKDVR